MQWREWSQETFDEAQVQDKPILLDIGAVWCHWCHVMDEGIAGDPVHTGTYSDPQIAQVINSEFIPIKVDNDRRPDINARYNMGGWPTTAFLTPLGDTLYGETYVPPSRMLELLDYISNYYRTNKGDIAAKVAEHEQERVQPTQPQALTMDIVEYAVGAVKANFDFAFGGFGNAPKFPHSEALAFAIRRYAVTRDEELRLIVEKTLDAMVGGGTYDRYAGGFFRYSTTRDWSIPHYEKMLEDNANLSEVCLLAAKVFGEERFADIAKDVHGWLFEVMFDQATGTFAGSQDADKEEEYYGLPLDQRANLQTPFIDRTIYVGWNALLVSSLVERYRAFREVEILSAAARIYQFIQEQVWPKHYFADGAAQGTEYLLGDASALLDAAMDLAEATGEDRYITDAQQFGSTLLDKLQDKEQGGFYDAPVVPNALGALSEPKKEFASNAAAASALLRMSSLKSNAAYREAAEAALKLFVEESRTYSFFSAGYASAIAAALAPDVHIVIVGDIGSNAVEEMRQAAWSAHKVSPAIELRSPASAGDYPADPAGNAIAYVCVGTTCKIASSADSLTEALRFISARV